MDTHELTMRIMNEMLQLTDEYNAIQKRAQARWENDEPKNDADIERSRFLDAEIRRLEIVKAEIENQEAMAEPIL